MHLVSRFACNDKVKRAQIHHLRETNYFNNIPLNPLIINQMLIPKGVKVRLVM